VIALASLVGQTGAKITGGKVMSGKTKRVVNRAAQSFRLAAAALRSSKSALGAYFRGCAHAWT
jgi:transposase